MLSNAANCAVADETALIPHLSDRGRYQVSVTYYLENVITRTDDRELALATLDAFAKRFAGEKEAHGAVYDFEKLEQLVWFWGKPKSAPENPMIAIFERQLRSGAPVSIITERGRRDCNVGAGE